MMNDDVVLLVDDERSILNLIERLFDETGLRILKAANADEAMEFVRKENISVLVSDNLMPGMKGIDLLSKVRVISPDIVRILMTAYADLTTAVDAINKGEVFRFIVKPWDDDDLIETIKEGIKRYQIVRTLKRADEATLLSLARTIELKDKYTRGHCDRVAGYALLMADELNLPEETKRDIRYGSWLHDCGKIGIPESILNKNGPLDEEEFEVIKKHPLWGADVARQAQLSEVIINIILHHHERYDGKGYPFGIKGTDIPIEARIVAVADCFDAITTDRSYRKAASGGKGLEIILSMKERNFAPEIVELFISGLKSISCSKDTQCIKDNLNEHGDN